MDDEFNAQQKAKYKMNLANYELILHQKTHCMNRKQTVKIIPLVNDEDVDSTFPYQVSAVLTSQAAPRLQH